jgi:acetyl-CoA carboxylase / biotin carboxylase 1
VAARRYVSSGVLGQSAPLMLVPIHYTGANTVGMVAWMVEYFPPECPGGRKAVLIGNDITHIIGSFGPQEDRVRMGGVVQLLFPRAPDRSRAWWWCGKTQLFAKASELARRQGLPRIYISANSGARIGIAEEVMAVFRVAWINPENPAKGTRTRGGGVWPGA